MADKGGRKKQNTNQQSGGNKQGGKGGSFAPAEGFKFDFGVGSNPNEKKQQQSGGGKGQQEVKLQNVIDFSGKEGQALLKGIQAKLSGLVGASSGYLESLPKVVQSRVKALKKIQADHDDLEDQYEKELAELEKKYDALKKPLYERRSAIVTGVTEPTPEELAYEEKKEKEEKKEGEKEGEKKEEVKKEETKKEGTSDNNNKDENVKGIPEFWLQALRHHPDFGDLITEKDIDALKSLKDIQVKSLEDGVSFTIEFTFDSNPYFEDTLLTKTYHLREQYGEIMFQSVDGTDIHWKPGKNLTVEIVTKTTGGGRGGRRGQRGGKQQQPRTVKVEQPCESFFNFFNPEAFSGMGAEEDELEDEELEALLEADYEMGAAIKEQIIPNAVRWFTGEAELEFDDEEDDEGEEDEDAESGEEGGEEEEYNSEEDEDYQPPPPGQEQQPECKQQ